MTPRSASFHEWNRRYAKRKRDQTMLDTRRIENMQRLLVASLISAGVKISATSVAAFDRTDASALDEMRARRDFCREMDATIFAAHPRARIDLAPEELALERQV